jgi:hypothetical protein
VGGERVLDKAVSSGEIGPIAALRDRACFGQLPVDVLPRLGLHGGRSRHQAGRYMVIVLFGQPDHREALQPLGEVAADSIGNRDSESVETMEKSRYPSTLYFILVKDDEGNLNEWTHKNTIEEARDKKLEMEENRGYEKFTIEIKPVPAMMVQDFMNELRKAEKQAREKAGSKG